MRSLAVFLAAWMALPAAPASAQQALNIVVVEGEGAINNIRQRTAREPIVEVQDENHRPVAGAVVVFALPSQGASGTFASGVQTLTVMTDAQGRAVGRGLRPNRVQGRWEIRVTASSGAETASAAIAETNALAAGAGAAAGGASGKLIAILVVAGAAVAGGVVAGVRLSGGGSTSPTTISAGSGTVGAPR
jgi:hypothetical protein